MITCHRHDTKVQFTWKSHISTKEYSKDHGIYLWPNYKSKFYYLTFWYILENWSKPQWNGASIAEWLCCLAPTIKVLCPNLSATRHGMALVKSLVAFCFGSLRRTLYQASLLSRAAASNSFRKNIGLSKLSPNSTLYRKVRYSFFLISSVKRSQLNSNGPLRQTLLDSY
jgi:hypothetical protein